MNSDKRQLLADLLEEDFPPRRQRTLLAGARIMRRKRRRRAVVRIVFAIALVGLASVTIQKVVVPHSHTFTAVPAPSTEIKGLTDAELLALFPETPVALVTLENGKKRLLFPRPGDAERFVSPL